MRTGFCAASSRYSAFFISIKLRWIKCKRKKRRGNRPDEIRFYYCVLTESPRTNHLENCIIFFFWEILLAEHRGQDETTRIQVQLMSTSRQSEFPSKRWLEIRPWNPNGCFLLRHEIEKSHVIWLLLIKSLICRNLHCQIR